MRWWDGGVRIRAALVALNVAALGVMAPDLVRLVCGAVFAWISWLVARSFRRGPDLRSFALTRLPERTDALYIGKGFEWTTEAAQETMKPYWFVLMA